VKQPDGKIGFEFQPRATKDKSPEDKSGRKTARRSRAA